MLFKSRNKKIEVKEWFVSTLLLVLITNFNYFKELRLMLVTHIYIVKSVYYYSTEKLKSAGFAMANWHI